MTDAIEPAYMTWARERFGKAESTVAPEPRTLRPATGPDRHPVLAAMPPDIRLAVYRHGRLWDMQPGDRLGVAGGVAFVLSGAVGLFPNDGSGVCLGLAGPGAVANVEALTAQGPRRDVRALVRGAALCLQGPELTRILGRTKTDELLIDQLLLQHAALEREAACNALHLAPARLARWLLMLHEAAGGGDIHITQAALAQMMGIQRTSVNAAARSLQDCGGLRFVRGRVRILKPQALRAQACDCLRASGATASEGAPVEGDAAGVQRAT